MQLGVDITDFKNSSETSSLYVTQAGQNADLSLSFLSQPSNFSTGMAKSCKKLSQKMI